ncbi:hypothetical protein GCM10010254_20680 [Streptomyces chromofuscus]|nr:hypothetical protein GCM10010254_20680 [Streptomyces chromofuscus]
MVGVAATRRSPGWVSFTIPISIPHTPGVEDAEHLADARTGRSKSAIQGARGHWMALAWACDQATGFVIPPSTRSTWPVT